MKNSAFLTLAGRLKWARQNAGLSQSSLAKKCGLTQGAIGHVETGSRSTLPKLARVASELGVRALWLEEGVGPSQIDDESHAALAPEQPAYETQSGFLSSSEISELLSLFGVCDAAGRESVMRAARSAAALSQGASSNGAANKRKRSV